MTKHDPGEALATLFLGPRYHGPHDYVTLRTHYSFHSGPAGSTAKIRLWGLVLSIQRGRWPTNGPRLSICRVKDDHDPYWREAHAHRINLGNRAWR